MVNELVSMKMVPMMDVPTAMMRGVRTVLVKEHMKVWHLVRYYDLGMAHMMAHS